MGRGIPDNDLRYVDTPEFWKEQYTRIHAEKKLLEDKICRLEESQKQHRVRHEDENRNMEDENVPGHMGSDIRNGLGSEIRVAEHDDLEMFLRHQNNRERSTPTEDILLILSSYSAHSFSVSLTSANHHQSCESKGGATYYASHLRRPILERISTIWSTKPLKC